MHDQNYFSQLSSDRSAEDRALDRLLPLGDRTGIPISFDVVGHLFHDSCSGNHPGDYPDGWWKHDPGSSTTEDPLFYAPDLPENIRRRSPDHEICTHTYSHVLADECDKGVLERELSTVVSLHENRGLPTPTSIVMPRHREVDYSLLKKYGVRTIRRPIRDYGFDGSQFGKFPWILLREHPTCQLRYADGIVETTCTPHPSLTSTALQNGQQPPALHFRMIPRSVRERLHRRYLKRAIQRTIDDGKHIHLWTHLHNFANNSQWRAIEPALEMLADALDRGLVDVRPMRSLREVVE
jgi:peptidoglycan/xylan/chitin deacetylase (PgdA/CDA1 family)